MAKKKQKKENPLKCGQIIKFILLKYSDWVDQSKLKTETNDFNLEKYGKKIRDETFTKSIENLLKKQDVAVKRVIMPTDESKCPPRDNVCYSYKLVSKFADKYVLQINGKELVRLFKKEYTDYLFFECDLSDTVDAGMGDVPLFDIDPAYDKLSIDGLDTEIIAKDKINPYRTETAFIIHICDCKSSSEATLHYEKYNKFSLSSSYKNIILDFKKIDAKDQKEIMQITFPYNLYRVKLDNSEYINDADNRQKGFNKAVLLVYNTVIIIYDYRQMKDQNQSIVDTLKLFSIIQKQIKENL